MARFVDYWSLVPLIITVASGPSGSQVRVDGWLAGDGTAELEQALKSVAAPIQLLVHDLRGADAAGLSVLQRLDAEGAALVGLSPYLRLALASTPSPGSTPVPSSTRPETSVRSHTT